MGALAVRETTFGDYDNCVSLSNGDVEIVASRSFGPRVLRYGLLNRPNAFLSGSALSVPSYDSEWRLYGGHRLWCSPELYPRTYEPDNEPIDVEETDTGIVLRKDPGRHEGIEKTVDIELNPTGSRAKVTHSIENQTAWPIETAVWAITVLAPGGLGVVPISQMQTHFSEGAKGARYLTAWAYTKLNDPRLFFGERYLGLRQRESIKESIKLGISNRDGWCAYVHDDFVFGKRFAHNEEARYPDNNASTVMYASGEYLELESFSPLSILRPGEGLSHTEEWFLSGPSDAIPEEEDGIQAAVASLFPA